MAIHYPNLAACTADGAQLTRTIKSNTYEDSAGSRRGVLKFATARKEPLASEARGNASIEKRPARQGCERFGVEIVLRVISAWASLRASGRNGVSFPKGFGILVSRGAER